jgi:hypothetical protein
MRMMARQQAHRDTASQVVRAIVSYYYWFSCPV